MMLAGLGETKQAIDAANSALDHQAVAALVPVHAGHTEPAAGSRLRSIGISHGPHQILARDGANDRTSAPIRPSASECGSELLAALKQ